MLGHTPQRRHDMARHARTPAEYRDRGFIWAVEDQIFADDWLLAAAYAVAEAAVAYLGPFFWISLSVALLAAELGR